MEHLTKIALDRLSGHFYFLRGSQADAIKTLKDAHEFLKQRLIEGHAEPMLALLNFEKLQKHTKKLTKLTLHWGDFYKWTRQNGFLPMTIQEIYKSGWLVSPATMEAEELLLENDEDIIAIWPNIAFYRHFRVLEANDNDEAVKMKNEETFAPYVAALTLSDILEFLNQNFRTNFTVEDLTEALPELDHIRTIEIGRAKIHGYYVVPFSDKARKFIKNEQILPEYY